MISISSATLRRLRQIKQGHSTWEGTRCVLPANRKQRFGNVISLTEEGEQTECILWVDSTSGAMRAMAIVESGSGQEAIVRTLLQAIERPQNNLPPGRPQKVVVNDRESHFYLRGILQELDITVEFAEHLPLVEEILAHFFDNFDSVPPPVPPELAPALYQQAMQVWQIAPWEDLNDHEVVEIAINRWDVNSLYAIFMGKLGLEIGIIFYRSLDSLRQFRRSATRELEDMNLEETFLSQDCLFVLFNSAEELHETDRQIMHSYGWQSNTHYPCFGILHPLEGDRSFLYEEDAFVLTAALEGLQLFFKEHQEVLQASDYPAVEGKFILDSVPDSPTIAVNTLVEVSLELLEITDDEDDGPLICTDVIPDNSLIRMTAVSWVELEELRNHANYKVVSTKRLPEKTDKLSILLIQNSKPKALELIKEIDDREGLVGICFNPAEDVTGEKCELGLLVTGNEELHLFGEFYKTDRQREEAHKDWKQRCKQNKNRCVVIVAMGIRGDSRGKPRPQHILGYYEAALIPAESLGLGTLQAFAMLSPDSDDD